MTARIIIITILSNLLCENIPAGKKKHTIDSWLEWRYSQLAAVENPTKIRKSDLDQSEKPNRDGLFRMYPEKGFLSFPDGSWVLLTSHSAHAEDGLADISLIRTSAGEYYSNRGHCCLPILLYSKERVVSLDGFLKTTGKGEKGQETPWIRYQPKQGRAAKAAAAADEPEKEKKPTEEAKPRSR